MTASAFLVPRPSSAPAPLRGRGTHRRRGWEVPPYTEQLFRPRAARYALVIPVLNAGTRIRALLSVVGAFVPPADLVIADGGSTDGALEQSFLQAVGVRALLTNLAEGGLSAQLRMGYAWAMENAYDGVITMDGCGGDGPAAVATFAARLGEGYDYVQGSRYRRGGQSVNAAPMQTLARVLVHAPALSLLSRRVFTDPCNGFRAYSRRLLCDTRVATFRTIFAGGTLLPYLTVRASRLGFRCCEVPVRRDDGHGARLAAEVRNAPGPNVLREVMAVAAGRYDPQPPSAS